MPTVPSHPFVTQPRVRSGPTSPTTPHHLTLGPPSPTSFQRNRLSASVPNIVGLARTDPLQPSSCPLEIRLSSDVVVLRCTGQTTEPASLTGSVVLYLAGATAIKGVGLRLQAKAKVALPLNDGCGSQRSLPSATLTVCLLDLGGRRPKLQSCLNVIGTSSKATRRILIL